MILILAMFSSRAPAAAAVAALSLALAGCAGGGPSHSGGRPVVVVTTTVLGSVVRDVVGDAAQVDVVMPNGADPHEYQPSARQIAELDHADLVVDNGLGLEEGLTDALDQARSDGVPFYTASDHVELRRFSPDQADEIAEHGPYDPHIWTDPIAMARVTAGLAPALRRDLGIDVAARARDEERRLRALDRRVRAELAPIPPDRRVLVTGHESMGYFAARYGFRLVGALVPSLSSQAEGSASHLAGLAATVEREKVPAIFAETGEPSSLTSAIEDDTGARVVGIDTERLPSGEDYGAFLLAIAAGIREGLGT
jgi:zinc/manganese transport system substrate-binding protein